MNPEIVVLLSLGTAALLIWAVVHRRSRTVDEVLDDLPDEGDVKPRVQINQQQKDDPCRPLDMPDLPGNELCPAIQEAKDRLSDLPVTGIPVIPSVVAITQNPKMTRADALKAANRNRQAEGLMRAQKARDALANNEDPVKVAAECGYKTVKYMKEKVRELEREGMPA